MITLHPIKINRCRESVVWKWVVCVCGWQVCGLEGAWFGRWCVFSECLVLVCVVEECVDSGWVVWRYVVWGRRCSRVCVLEVRGLACVIWRCVVWALCGRCCLASSLLPWCCLPPSLSGGAACLHPHLGVFFSSKGTGTTIVKFVSGKLNIYSYCPQNKWSFVIFSTSGERNDSFSGKTFLKYVFFSKKLELLNLLVFEMGTRTTTGNKFVWAIARKSWIRQLLNFNVWEGNQKLSLSTYVVEKI